MEPLWYESWQPKPLLGKHWAPFDPVVVEGVAGLQVKADSSLSVMRRKLSVPSREVHTLRFYWWVDRLLPEADLSDADTSDSPAQLLLAFDGDRERFSARNAMMSELSRLVSGEELPYASLVYAWANDQPAGTVITDPRTDRIRYLVVEQGTAHLGHWVTHDRDVRADFEKAFGELPGALLGMALMTDSDNTRSQTRTVYGPVELNPVVQPVASGR